MSLINKILNKTNRKEINVYAPVSGKMIRLEDFPDQVFAKGILGLGCGIMPETEKVVSPFNGTVSSIVDTRHAVGITSEDGVVLLIHIGVDTVKLGGDGFNCRVLEGQKIHMGETLIEFCKEKIVNAGCKEAIAIVVTNSGDFSQMDVVEVERVKAASLLIEIKK